jgi:tetratricopeptide (TPR) repeat protein
MSRFVQTMICVIVTVTSMSYLRADDPDLKEAARLQSVWLYPEAIRAYTKIIENQGAIGPSIEAVTNRAICYELVGDFQHAIDDYSIATQIQPKNPEWWLSRALCFMDRKDYRGALVDLDRSVVVSQNSPVMLLARGLCRLRLGDKPAAETDIKAALDLDSQCALTLVRLQAMKTLETAQRNCGPFLAEFSGNDDLSIRKSKLLARYSNAQRLAGGFDGKGRFRISSLQQNLWVDSGSGRWPRV